MRISELHFCLPAVFGAVFFLVLGLCILTAADEPAFSPGGGQTPASTIRVSSAVIKIADSVDVPAEYSGVLTKVFVKEGQLVQQGEPIAKINDAELRLRCVQAKYENEIAKMTAENDVDIRFSEKSREVAIADVQRSKRANVKVPNSVPAARLNRQVLEQDRTTLQLEQAKRDFAIAELKTKLTEMEMQHAELLLQKTEICSPMDGMVVSVERHQGEWVEPSETVVRIVRVNRLRIEGFVSAAQAGRIRLGAPVQVKFSQDWLKNRNFTGSVVFVSPEANPVSSEILVWAEISNEHNDLLPGLRGEIEISADDTPLSAKN